jgi:hypothetical protein
MLASDDCLARSLWDYEIDDPCRGLAVGVEGFDQDSYRVLPEEVAGQDNHTSDTKGRATFTTLFVKTATAA